ncbi:hypothetical protein DOY81_013040, partial [Sarcophaga bullata]
MRAIKHLQEKANWMPILRPKYTNSQLKIMNILSFKNNQFEKNT